ncbi:hypothetical protein ACFCX4_18495 [Kitasatospora sp. NPDC056327]|uniref:hypothetical protein n=1 Tax=Kitasatospora sp. NPDC056327 TaxID=3345785 RepID=UPI0035DF186C
MQRLQGAVDGVPSTDPALNTTVGRAPRVELTGESDPARADAQAAGLREGSARILAVGRDDAARPLGEGRIHPDVPEETLTAAVPGGGPARGGAPGAGRAADAGPGVGLVAQQERGPQIRAAADRGRARLVSEEAAQAQGETEARRRNQAELDGAVADSARAQAGERGEAAERVAAEREQWRTEQDGRISAADREADAEHRDSRGRIDGKRTGTDQEVRDRQQEDNRRIQDRRREAEEKAQQEKDRKKEESEGWWGWVKSKVKAAFDALVAAVTKVFEHFRGLVNAIVDGFRTFVNRAIDQARKFAVELITGLADALIRICDVLLAAFPELRDRFRRRIEEWRDRAVARVNAWADRLKSAVNRLLDALAAGLNALLNALEAGLKAAVEAVRRAVLDAVDLVRKAIAVFGEFAVLIGDVAADPGGWLRKLGTAAVDGVRLHLWGAIRRAVKQWFDQKVESVVGLTSTVVDVLVKGCVSMAQIGRMAWQAIVAALPGMIVSIVVEKLVSLIVPAAGAIMAIIQGLVAAWNTVSRIVAAIGRFVAFLKAVRSGSAACLFADAVAAGVVALLDFISNFLLSRLKAAGRTVGGRLKGIAQRILKGLARAGRGARKAAGRAVNKARAGLRRAARALRRRPSPGRAAVPLPARRPTTAGGRRRGAVRPRSAAPRRPGTAVGRALEASRRTVRAALGRVGAAARALGRRLLGSRLGRALTDGARRIRDAYRRQRDRLRDWHRKRRRQRAERRARENSPRAKQQRLDLIVARVRPRIQRLLARGVRPLVLRTVLAGLRAWYRLTGLAEVGSPAFTVEALLNPRAAAGGGFELTAEELRVIIRTQAAGLLDRADVVAVAAHMRLIKHQAGADALNTPLRTEGGKDVPGAVRYLRNRGTALELSAAEGGPRVLPPYTVDWGRKDLYLVGPEGGPVSEQQKTGASNSQTMGVGHYHRLPGLLDAAHLTDMDFAMALRAYSLNRRLPPSFTPEQQTLVRNTHWLMFVRESVRSTANLGYAAVTTDLLARGPGAGGLDRTQVFAAYEGSRRGDRGWYPMSMRRAASAARGLEQEEAGQLSHFDAPAADRAELRFRELQLGETWALARTGGQGILATTEAETVKKGEDLVRRFLLGFYGLS